MNALLEGYRVYATRRMLVVFLLGLCSGLPNALVTGTLAIWLRDVGIDRTSIGVVSLVGLAYAINFLWAPLVDRIRLPWLSLWGQRRSWLLLIQGLLVTLIVSLAGFDPTASLGVFVLAIGGVAFLSASQDIAIDAYRVEYLRPDEFAAGSAMATFGWLCGAQVMAGFVLLHLAGVAGFGGAYATIGLVLLLGPVVLWLAGEPISQAQRQRQRSGYEASAGQWLRGMGLGGVGRLTVNLRAALQWLYVTVIVPFQEFTQRPAWFAILAFVVLFKLGDAMLGRMTGVLYIDLGFSTADIANYSKMLGLGAFLLGAVVGGVMARRYGVLKALLASGIATAATNLLYAWLAASGQDYTLFALAIGGDNFTTGMVTTTFVAYLSSLCNIAFTATQYAMLSSLANMAMRLFAASAGGIVDWLERVYGTIELINLAGPLLGLQAQWPGMLNPIASLGGAWSVFFLLTVLLAMPGLLLLLWMMKRFGDPVPPGREPVSAADQA